MEPEVLRTCRTHGVTPFVLEGRGYYRCKACRRQRVMDWRRRAKLRLVAEAGGRCALCGYDRYTGALHFHHVDPSEKSFGLSVRGVTRSIERLRAEAEKCVLLCSNCHAEVQWGIVELPTPSTQAPGGEE
jgi:5-methylcytosine-specific restriction endonuclease McrA